MGFLSDLLSGERLRYLAIRISLCAFVLLIYLMVWRPARVMITKQFVHPQVEYFEAAQTRFEAELESGALLVFYNYGDSRKELQYRPQFGFFFLIALAALFFVTNRRKPYLILAGLHLGGSVLTYLFLMVGTLGFQPGFILTDAISGYLIPALSLGLVPLEIKGMISGYQLQDAG